MNTTIERLRKFKSSTPSRWREEAEARLAHQEDRRMARKLAMQMLNAMERIGISESTLAKQLGIDKKELSSYLKGHQLPSQETKIRISNILAC